MTHFEDNGHGTFAIPQEAIDKAWDVAYEANVQYTLAMELSKRAADLAVKFPQRETAGVYNLADDLIRNLVRQKNWHLKDHHYLVERAGLILAGREENPLLAETNDYKSESSPDYPEVECTGCEECDPDYYGSYEDDSEYDNWHDDVGDENLGYLYPDRAPDDAILAALADMKDRYDRGETLTGHDLAILYGYGHDEQGVLVHDTGLEANIGQTEEGWELQGRERTMGNPAYRYQDYCAIAEALGATVGDLVMALSDDRLADLGTLRYEAWMNVALGRNDEGNDIESGELALTSHELFMRDRSIDPRLLVAMQNPLEQLLNRQYMADYHDYDVTFDSIAANLASNKEYSYQYDLIFKELDRLVESNLDLGLAELSKITATPIRELLEKEEVRKAYGNGTIVEGEV